MTGLTFTHPEVFAAAADGAAWADREVDPTRIGWDARQAACPAAFAAGFRLVDGRPVSPGPATGVRYGRNRLGHWGPQLCADVLVMVRNVFGRRWIAMVDRDRTDGTGGFALPGGYVDPGEDPTDAAFRELAEETGLVVDRAEEPYVTLPARYVPDPRASDEAWMVTVPTRVDLGDYFEAFPALTPQPGEALRVAWVLADSYHVLTGYLASEYRAEVFPAHRQMLADILDA